MVLERDFVLKCFGAMCACQVLGPVSDQVDLVLALFLAHSTDKVLLLLLLFMRLLANCY